MSTLGGKRTSAFAAQPDKILDLRCSLDLDHAAPRELPFDTRYCLARVLINLEESDFATVGQCCETYELPSTARDGLRDKVFVIVDEITGSLPGDVIDFRSLENQLKKMGL